MSATTAFKMPDVTPAQIMAIVTFVASQAVAYGAISSQTEAVVLSVAGTVVAAALKIADAIIRNGRAQVAAAQVAKK